MCGEKLTLLYWPFFQQGSPPRVRGKDITETGAAWRWGITPACAGKRGCKMTPAFLSWDHPRVCGEKFVDESHAFKNLGSPPRVRGKATASEPDNSRTGITPACAGKSAAAAALISSPRDHPRVCGEKTGLEIKIWTTQGSPPRVRGKAHLLATHPLFLRITPACAGKSHPAMLTTSGGRDHPRVCGEKTKKIP